VSATAGTLNFSAIPFGALLGGLAAQGLSAALGTREGLALTLTVSGLAAGSGTLALLRRTVRSLP
jgi:hypothetical protein